MQTCGLGWGLCISLLGCGRSLAWLAKSTSALVACLGFSRRVYDRWFAWLFININRRLAMGSFLWLQPHQHSQWAGVEGGPPGRDGRHDGAHAQDHLRGRMLPRRQQAGEGLCAVHLHQLALQIAGVYGFELPPGLPNALLSPSAWFLIVVLLIMQLDCRHCYIY